MKGNSWIWMLVCLLIYLLLHSTVGKYFHLPPCLVKPLSSSQRVLACKTGLWWFLLCPGCLLVLREMPGEDPGGFCWEEAHTLILWGLPSQPAPSSHHLGTRERCSGLLHTHCSTAKAHGASPNGKGMPCHPVSSACLGFILSVNSWPWLLPLLPQLPSLFQLQDCLVFLGIRQREGFLLIGINNPKGHIFSPLWRERGWGEGCLK